MINIYKHISAKERDIVAHLRSQGKSIRYVAKYLDRSPSTISREISRNGCGTFYSAITAQALSKKRSIVARRRHPLKNEVVFRYVVTKLIRGWSPEQISGRMKLEYSQDLTMRVSPECIYQFVYSSRYKHRRFWEYLPWKRKRRKKKRGRKVHRSRIPNRVSIHLREKHINERSEFGHWEGDSVVGKRGTEGIHTEVERKTRYTKARLIEGVNSTDTVRAQMRIFQELTNKARRSTTLDNGKEFTQHTQLTKKLGMMTYFADPYSSWQRGTNEYHNGLIRRYLPKGTDFAQVTQEELDEIVEEINNRPRKCLGYYTPKEVFLKELKKSVALPP